MRLILEISRDNDYTRNLAYCQLESLLFYPEKTKSDYLLRKMFVCRGHLEYLSFKKSLVVMDADILKLALRADKISYKQNDYPILAGRITSHLYSEFKEHGGVSLNRAINFVCEDLRLSNAKKGKDFNASVSELKRAWVYQKPVLHLCAADYHANTDITAVVEFVEMAKKVKDFLENYSSKHSGGSPLCKPGELWDVDYDYI